MTNKQVVPDRTNWRDEKLSKRHRMWGFHCPAVDLDFVLVEYASKRPVALVEYKAKRLPDDFIIESSNVEVLFRLGQMSNLPVFVVEYYKETAKRTWKVTGINSLGLKKMSYFFNKINHLTVIECDELMYVKFLYHLRGHSIDPLVEKYIVNNPF